MPDNTNMHTSHALLYSHRQWTTPAGKAGGLQGCVHSCVQGVVCAYTPSAAMQLYVHTGPAGLHTPTSTLASYLRTCSNMKEFETLLGVAKRVVAKVAGLADESEIK